MRMPSVYLYLFGTKRPSTLTNDHTVSNCLFIYVTEMAHAGFRNKTKQNKNTATNAATASVTKSELVFQHGRPAGTYKKNLSFSMNE
jgi:hypothetical protein